MKQKIKQRLIAIVGLLLSTTVFAYDFKTDGIYYNILSSENKTVEVTYKDSNYDSYIGEIHIPEYVKYDNDSYVVSQIGMKAFYNCSFLTSIYIPPTIKNINHFAFEGCNHLSDVNISNLSTWCKIKCSNSKGSPLYYGAELFLNGETLKDLESLTSECDTIGDYAFFNQSSLTNVLIPDSTNYVGIQSFDGCSKIEKLIIGKNVEYLAEGAFRNCTSLKTIIFNDSEKDLHITRYKQNISYPFFNDSPLDTIYLGRKLNVESNAYNYDYYKLFTKVRTAIINCDNSFNNFYGKTSSLENVYLGERVSELEYYPKELKNIYCFSSNIIKNKGCESQNIYVIDKNNLSDVFLSMGNATFFNLAEVNNLESGKTYEYGTITIPFLAPTIVNNVQDMDVKVNTNSLNLNAGHYNEGIAISFSNEIWSVDIIYPLEYTITKAPVTIIANDATRRYGEENPEFSCSYFGFKNGESDSVLITKPTIATTATIDSSVGSYPIIPTNAEAKNYTFTYERGNLTITQASQTINWDQSFDKVLVGDQIELNAEATSGLAVKYTVSDESIAEIYTSNGKTYLDCIKNGEVILKANQSGNDNYLAADRVSKTIVINKISGVNNVDIDNNATEVARYDIYGHRLSEPTKGINIVKHSDGTTRKEFVK